MDSLPPQKMFAVILSVSYKLTEPDMCLTCTDLEHVCCYPVTKADWQLCCCHLHAACAIDVSAQASRQSFHRNATVCICM